MIDLYIKLIQEGLRTLEQVPIDLKEQVANKLNS